MSVKREYIPWRPQGAPISELEHLLADAAANPMREVRAMAAGSGTIGTVVPAPAVAFRGYHPNLHVMFVPDDRACPIEVWPKGEFEKYFRRIY